VNGEQLKGLQLLDSALGLNEKMASLKASQSNAANLATGTSISDPQVNSL
jgi:hypothetical protein